jgi:hypothetical protein
MEDFLKNYPFTQAVSSPVRAPPPRARHALAELS